MVSDMALPLGIRQSAHITKEMHINISSFYHAIQYPVDKERRLRAPLQLFVRQSPVAPFQGRARATCDTCGRRRRRRRRRQADGSCSKRPSPLTVQSQAPSHQQRDAATERASRARPRAPHATHRARNATHRARNVHNASPSVKRGCTGETTSGIGVPRSQAGRQ